MLDIETLGRRFGEHADAVETALKQAGEKTEEIRARLFDLEQKSVRRGGGGEDYRAKSWGEQFAGADEVKTFAGETSRPGRVRLEMKTITSASGSAGALVTPARDNVVTMPKRRMVVRDLLPVIGVESGSVEFARQNLRQNAATPVAEGALKPESNYGFEIVSTPIRTLAHWTVVSSARSELK